MGRCCRGKCGRESGSFGGSISLKLVRFAVLRIFGLGVGVLALADNRFKESETYVDHTQTVGTVSVTGQAHFLAAGSVEVAEQAVRSCRTNYCPAVVDFAAAAADS